MKNSDLKDGMVVEVEGFEGVNNYKLHLVMGNKIFNEKGYTEKRYFDDNLKHTSFNHVKIVAVYKVCDKNIKIIKDIFCKENLELIWERSREIDWNKVPKWTKVVVNQLYYKNTYNRYFLNRTKDGFKACGHKPDGFTKSTERDIVEWDECRIHPSVEIKEEWYK